MFMNGLELKQLRVIGVQVGTCSIQEGANCSLEVVGGMNDVRGAVKDRGVGHGT